MTSFRINYKISAKLDGGWVKMMASLYCFKMQTLTDRIVDGDCDWYGGGM